MKQPFREGTRAMGYAITGLAALALLTLIVTLLFGGVSRLTAPFRGETEKIERTEGDGAFRQATYEEFFDLCAAVQSAEAKVASLTQELDSEPTEARASRINTSLTAVRNSRAESITTYNSKAAQEHRSAFRDAGLPARLHLDSKDTQCAA